MPLENKGLALIRKYEAQKAEEGHSNFFGGCILALGGMGALLYATDLVRNGNTPGGIGMSWQPSWTPGYEINHDGVHQWGELGYLAGYIGATALGAWAARKVARPMARKLREWRHESSGEKARDEEFNANYSTLAHRLLAGEEVPSGLHQDYKDSLRLDILTHHLTTAIFSGGLHTALDLAPRRAELVRTMLKEHMMKEPKMVDPDYESIMMVNYKQFLKVQDLIDLGNHYVESGRLQQAENFISDHLEPHKRAEYNPEVQFRILCMREKIADSFYRSGQLADAERVWKILLNKEKLRTLSAAYRKAGDESNAARVFAEHWQ